MGERHSGDGPFGRRQAQPGGTLSAPDQVDREFPGTGFEARLAAALRADAVDSEAERLAVAAFRAARERGASPSRTRRRDDWRPAAPRRVRPSLKATLSVALASLTLGGVAVAAIGSAGSGAGHRPGTPRPAHASTAAPHRPTAPGRSDGTAGPGSAAPATRPNHPDSARDTVAHCRTYERAGARGGALDSTAWQRLVTAAGGADKVAAYCAAHVANDTTSHGKSQENDRKSGKAGAGSGAGAGNAKPKATAGNTKPADGAPKAVKGD
ncbi:hypothetical protein AB0L59_06530 [Streptomyces sp. NPDC052109]|uniref:hypothetical protein n=1 Tax=Streptomyces sp. NPDC052109 TaxID=3155527 RepID=UPI003433450F